MHKICNNAIRWFTVSLIGVSIFLSGSVGADEITDSIEEAIEYYKDGDFVEAANSLDYATEGTIFTIVSAISTSNAVGAPKLVPFLIVFYAMGMLFGTTIVAVIPFNLQTVLPFLEGWIGRTTIRGFGLTFYGFYLLVGLGLGNLIRRPFGQSMTT